MENSGRHIGIMGGTFDPVHIGHLLLAEHAKEQFALDTIYMMPNGTPAYKSDHVVTDARMRVEMTALAIKSNAALELSMIEVERKGNTYTYETLEQLKAAHPQDTYYFIIGADSLFAFEGWMEPQRIASSCVLLVANRDRVPLEQLQSQVLHLQKMFSADIRILNCPGIDISSAMIRQRVSEGKSIRYYVTDDVAAYISMNGLYQEKDGCKQ